MNDVPVNDSRFPGLRRRGFLAAAGGAAGLGALALAGCAGSGTAADPAKADGKPKRGGRLRAAFAGGGASETLDPHLANLFADAARAKALFDKLADYGPDLSAQPRLASSWEPNAGLDRWKVTLRKAAFHDGKPVTAQDVLYSYRRIANPAKAFRAKASLEPIDLKASRALDARTIEFVLKRPTAEFPNVLAAFGAYIVPEGAQDFDKKPVGSGPFRFVSFAPGKSAVFKRNDAYWDGAPTSTSWSSSSPTRNRRAPTPCSAGRSSTPTSSTPPPPAPTRTRGRSRSSGSATAPCRASS